MAAKSHVKLGFFSSLSEREQRLVKIMLSVFGVLAVVLVLGLFVRSMSELEAETQRYKSMLDQVAVEGPQFLERAQNSAQSSTRRQFSEEDLSENNLQLTSFVATQATAADIKIDNYKEDKIPLGSRSAKDAGPIIIEKQLRIEIRNAEMNKLLEFLDRLENASEPVVVKRMDLRADRRDEGEVRGAIVISTFVKREQED